nr:alkane hydroxylase MAH1-like [Ipomoea trifida]
MMLKFSMSSDKQLVPRNWPVVGMMPALLKNVHQLHEMATAVLKHSGGTFEFKGPAGFPNLSMLGTCDPANIDHVLTKNFSNYHKGPEFRKIFDIFGDGVINADSQLWKIHRKTILSVLNHAQFYTMLETNVEKGLLPVLDWFAQQGAEFDLQDVFQRFTFDTISMLLLHHDPQSLCLGLPYLPCEKAFNHVVDAILYRHIFPESCWKLQKWVGIGKEKKLTQACHTLDEFVYSALKRLELKMMTTNNKKSSDLSCSLFAAYVQEYKQQEQVLTGSSMNKFVRDALLTLMFAGRDTTSSTLTWLFYLLAQNPLVQANIRDEIENKLNNLKQVEIFKVEECGKLVYLHAALCESLRLFPPAAIQHKVSAGMDVLPSGHLVKPNTRIMLLFYSSGRMDSIWGEDCMEFKPERWISDRGGIKHEPSYKFPAFNAGPRTCLGKEMSFVQMKMIAATILHHYEFQVVDPHSVCPSDSVVIQAKHGLKIDMMMAISSTAVALLFIIMVLSLGVLVCYMMMKLSKSSNKVLPRNWAIVGMMPALLKNAHRVHEFATDVLKHSGGTFEFKGSAGFPNLNMLVTSDPANIHHVLTKNFSNYPKGPQFRKIFDILGDGVFNVDSQLWEFHRKTTLSFFNHAQFYTLLEKNVEKGLLPVLDWFAEEGAEFDLQDVFQRFTFDTISKLVLNHDPQSLCLGLPYVPCEKAFNHVVDALLYRHILPQSCWKLQNWVGIGKEKKLIQAYRAFDEFIYSAIKRLELKMTTNDSSDLSLYTAYVQAYKQHAGATTHWFISE